LRCCTRMWTFDESPPSPSASANASERHANTQRKRAAVNIEARQARGRVPCNGPKTKATRAPRCGGGHSCKKIRSQRAIGLLTVFLSEVGNLHRLCSWDGLVGYGTVLCIGLGWAARASRLNFYQIRAVYFVGIRCRVVRRFKKCRNMGELPKHTAPFS
jgi:hypothetical protein